MPKIIGESLAEHRVETRLADLDAAVERSAAIETDLVFLAWKDWREIPVGPAARAYAQRVRETQGDAVSFLAHHDTTIVRASTPFPSTRLPSSASSTRSRSRSPSTRRSSPR